MKKLYLLIPLFFLLIGSAYSQNCSTLDILTTTDGSVCGPGSVTLDATSSGTGDNIVWYDAATGGSIVNVGVPFQTPEISSTTSYWAAEILGTYTAGSVGPIDNTIGGGGGTSAAITTYSMVFDVLMPTELVSVDIFPTAAVGSSSSIEIRDSAGTTLINVPYTTTVTGGQTAQTIPINVTLPVGTGYHMGQVGPISLYRNTGGAVFPYTSPYINITGSTFSNQTYYYYFYNWKFGQINITCESSRKEAIATVNNVADEDITALPYTHTANTATYFNNYSGAPGANCGTAAHYLEGYDVVYKYTANDDYILNVELSGLTKGYTGVFIYNSCNDIGTSCAAEGSANDNIGTHSFQTSVVNGSTYYFVVSSSAPTDSFDYTLNITGTTCANYPAPNGATSQNFISGQTLSDLDVTGPNITWYSDAAKTTVLPKTTVLVNGTTYYATQTFQTCEGNVLAVTVSEVPCSTLEVVSTVDNSVCGEGSVYLEAQGLGNSVNTDLFWYATASGGNRIGSGPVFKTPELSTTTSYWVSEASITGMISTGHGKTAPTGTSAFGSTLNYGLQFNATQGFTLTSVDVYSDGSGQLEISLFDSAGNLMDSATAQVTQSKTTATTVMLNFNVPPGNGYRLLQTSSPSISLIRDTSGNSFPYGIGTAGALGSITNGTYGTSSSNSTSYYYFYNWSVFEGQALCESPRKEVIATVNNVADELVTEPLPFIHTANTVTYGNNYSGLPGYDCGTTEEYLNGNDVVYQFSPTTGAVYSVMLSGLTRSNASLFIYESCYDIGSNCYAGIINPGVQSDFGLDEVPLFDGHDYFIVVSSKDAKSMDYTLTIDLATINCADYTAAPEGDATQFFQPGETLADLDVNGANLTWFSDAAGTTIIPSSTLLVDNTTYYVNQTLNTCVSNLLAVTVAQIDCSALEVISTQGGTIVCKGVTTLQAVGNGGPGTEIYWYDAATGGDLVHIGPNYTTKELTATKSFWATEVFIQGDVPLSGQGKISPTGTSSFGSTLNYGLQFDVSQKFTLQSVDVYPDDSGILEISLFDNTGTLLQTASATVGPGAGPTTVQLNFQINPGTGYRLLQTSNPSLKLIRDSSGNSFPYPLGTGGMLGAITNGTYGTSTSNSSSYYYFYNWTTGTGQVLCESPRKEAIATVSQNGDIIVPPTLPYIDANNNTSNYGNTFTGTPGSSCGTTENYLNGDDVVYMFTPTMDDIVDIRLKDLQGYYAGVFVYTGCGDIGTNCVAGATAGASSNDVEIEEFTVVNGQTYYIVVSSWLTTSVGYTLEIKGFDCATFPAPDGDANQQFVAPETLADLNVSTTMSTATLNWYSDAAGTISIPDTTPLVNGTTYYVSQTYGTCEGALLAITVSEVNCSNLDIVSTTGGAVSCKGQITLSAVSSGTGSDIYWYDAQTGGNFVGAGATYTTLPLTATKSYWAAEVLSDNTSAGGQAPELIHYKFNTGNVITNEAINPVGSNPANMIGMSVGGTGLEGTALIGTGGSSSSHKVETGWNTTINGSFTLGFWTSDIPPSSTLYYIFGDSGASSFRCFTNGAAGADNWLLRGGGLPDLTFTGAATMTPNYIHAVYDASAGTYTGYVDGVQVAQVTVSSVPNVTGSGLTIGGYSSSSGLSGKMDEFRWYNRALSATEIQATLGPIGGAVVCESPRKEAIATVNQTGDKIVGTLNYTDTDSTINFGNNFSGSTGCGLGGNYLDGYDVVYQYTPTADNIVTIELTGVSNSKTGVFIYDNCGDVGGNCLAGTVSNGGVYKIEDFYVTAGEDYFIVIASETGSTSYTLNIYGYDCLTDLNPPVGDASQYFVGTKDLTDLDVDQYIHSTGLTWYSDAAGTTVIPDTTPLVHNTTYYVSQNVLGCESDLLAITALEFACTDLEIVSKTDGVVCNSGSMILSAQGSGIGNEIYWYEQQTGGNPVGVGSTFETNVLTSTKSYWAEEVYIDGVTSTPGQGKTAPTGTSAFGSTLNYGLQFNATQAFTLESVDIYPTEAGTVEITLFDNLNNALQSVSRSVSGSGKETIFLNFFITPGNGYRLLQTSNPSIKLIRDSSGNSFPYQLGIGGMYGSITNGTYGSSSSNSSSYYYFFNWSITTGAVLCSSNRTEVIAQVNTTLPPAPTADAIQEFCGTGNTIGDLTAVGDNLTWYNDKNEKLGNSTPLVDGKSYYVSQTIQACEGPKTEVVVVILDKSDKPTGNKNQTFYNGDTLADLNVTGTDLLWYADVDRMLPLPETTVLVDQTTYYVSQTATGFCESDLLAITVHRILGTNDPAFANILVLPNPAREVVTISNNGPIETVTLYTMIGQRVIEQNASMQSEIKLDVTHLPSGTYLLNVKIDGKTGIFKVIKE